MIDALVITATLLKRLRLGGVVLVAGLSLAACSSSPSTSSANPATSFHTASVSGYGPALVDASGRTVYVLVTSGHTNGSCTAASGCTQVWHPLPLPSGKTSATAGSGAQAGLLSTTSNGTTTYPTYNGWVMYEYAGDTGPHQSSGEGLSSFGGTWYMLNAAGKLITMASTSTSTGGASY